MNRVLSPCELGLVGAIPRPKRTDWRIGIIGFGGIAVSHVSAYREAGWQVVAVADPDPQAQARARALLPGVRLYAAYQDLVADLGVEVIALLTQPTMRYPAVEAAFQNRKPVLTEKPLAVSAEEAERLAALSERVGIPLAVSQNYRWNCANFLAREVIRKGLIGTPFYAGIEIQGGQDVELADHPFYSKCEGFLTLQWNNHLADLLRCWLGRDPIRVLACTRRMKGQNFRSDNLLLSVADYGEGVTGHIIHSELLRSALRCARCRVDGDGGSVVFDLYGMQVTLQCERTGSEPCDIKPEGGVWASSFSGPMGELLRAIEEGREPETGASRNLPTIRHVVAEEHSARAGGVWKSV